MKIGVPKEIKNHEYRVGLPPAAVRELVGQGHEVAIEQSAGLGAGFADPTTKLQARAWWPRPSKFSLRARWW